MEHDSCCMSLKEPRTVRAEPIKYLIYESRRHHNLNEDGSIGDEMIDYDRMRERFITVNNAII